MNDLTVTPERLGVEIRELTRQAKAMTLYYGVEIGRRLISAKNLVPYGTWGAGLETIRNFHRQRRPDLCAFLTNTARVKSGYSARK